MTIIIIIIIIIITIITISSYHHHHHYHDHFNRWHFQGPVTALTWGHNDKRIFIATGSQVSDTYLDHHHYPHCHHHRWDGPSPSTKSLFKRINLVFLDSMDVITWILLRPTWDPHHHQVHHHLRHYLHHHLDDQVHIGWVSRKIASLQLLCRCLDILYSGKKKDLGKLHLRK